MHRRSFIGGSAASLAAYLGAKDVLAAGPSGSKPIKHFIFVRLPGGPSQMESWDPKPGHVNGGPTKAIDTKVKGMRWGAALLPLVEHSNNIAVVRTSSGIGEHTIATNYTMTGGFAPNPLVQHPALCSTIGWGLYNPERDLPPVIATSSSAHNAGFLGNTFDAYGAGAKLAVDNQWRQRIEQANQMRDEYYAVSPLAATPDFQEEVKHQARSSRLTLGISHKALDISLESPKTREFYGPGFGANCLLARRLIMAGVTSVEIAYGGWDHHENIFERATSGFAAVAKGLNCLVTELKELGLFDQTLILVGGEMGRSPGIEKETEGRGHFPQNTCYAVIGGKIKGQNVGESSPDGTTLAQPITMGQLTYSVLELMGMRPMGFFDDKISGRPQRYCPSDIPLPVSLI